MAKLLRPDVNTRFHIDYDWWSSQPRDVRMLTREHLCPECKDKFGKHSSSENIDWVDPDTGEVTVVDGLTYSLRECCSQRNDYISRSVPLAASIFRVLLASGNVPLSATEFYERIGRGDPQGILRVLLGAQVRTHYGIKPVFD